ncbi:hypothetical protein [Enterococcus faecium]|uniref:hypothetical protein n=1 Tax=Enterococcus faecium TaxID=1352 RepID=UPI000A3410F3|nr:hypothetical protein [Enterococcus faecium]OTO49852.1 hypothetical protein A5814_002940 [Enterococcus faecium]
MVEENGIQKNIVLLRSNTHEFKEKVLLYGNKMIGKKITTTTFEKWLKKKNFHLDTKDKSWQAIYMSILQHQFYISVAYERNVSGVLVTVMRLSKKR